MSCKDKCHPFHSLYCIVQHSTRWSFHSQSFEFLSNPPLWVPIISSISWVLYLGLRLKLIIVYGMSASQFIPNTCSSLKNQHLILIKIQAYFNCYFCWIPYLRCPLPPPSQNYYFYLFYFYFFCRMSWFVWRGMSWF